MPDAARSTECGLALCRRYVLWPKDRKLQKLGALQRANMRKGLQGDSAALFTGPLSWSKKDLDDFLVRVEEVFNNRKIHALSGLVIVIDQRRPEMLPDVFG